MSKPRNVRASMTDSDPVDLTLSHDFISSSVTSASHSRCLFPNSSVEEITKFRVSMDLVESKNIEDKVKHTIGDLNINLDIKLGSSGSNVFLGVLKNRNVAVKRTPCIKKSGNLEVDNLRLYDNHPNIIRTFGYVSDNQHNYICLELCKCSLDSLISFCSSKEFGRAQSVGDPDLINLMQGKQLWVANKNPSEIMLNLMRNIVSALDFLHTSRVVHTAINPENILVSDIFTAKLSHLGGSNLIPEKIISSSLLFGSGNFGWLPNDKSTTYALDMFSFGCILFYSLTGGLHPFGDEKDRVKNIANNQPSCLMEVNHFPEAKQLISSLLESNPNLRPKASYVLKHPMFWNTTKKNLFISEASDCFSVETQILSNLTALETRATNTLAKGWQKQVDKKVLGSMKRSYNDNNFGDLVRFFRNCRAHYSEIEKENIVSIKTIMGDMPDGFNSYFASRFPELLMVVYKIIFQYCRSKSEFKVYF